MNDPVFLVKLAQRLAFAFASGFIGSALVIFNRQIGDVIFGPLEFPHPPDPGPGVLQRVDEYLDPDSAGTERSPLRRRYGLVLVAPIEETVGELASSNEGADNTSAGKCA